jgi:anti-sigma factor ChrR (cupin superfamily)
MDQAQICLRSCKIFGYGKGTLDAIPKRVIVEHLKQCAYCTKEVEKVQMLIEKLAGRKLRKD